jgi:hypothetical protein
MRLSSPPLARAEAPRFLVFSFSRLHSWPPSSHPRLDIRCPCHFFFFSLQGSKTPGTRLCPVPVRKHPAAAASNHRHVRHHIAMCKRFGFGGTPEKAPSARHLCRTPLDKRPSPVWGVIFRRSIPVASRASVASKGFKSTRSLAALPWQLYLRGTNPLLVAAPEPFHAF